ncbi:cobaltochelatase subunit CobN [Desulfovulcanus sp.]
MNIAAIVWNSYVPTLVQASKNLDWLDLKIFSSSTLEKNSSKTDDALTALKKADVILLYRSSESFWEAIEKDIKDIAQNIPVVCLSHDPSYWALSTVAPAIVQTCYDYLTLGGEENCANMFCYIAREVIGIEIPVELPKEVPWEGLYHPQAPVSYFSSVDEYLQWYEEYVCEKNLNDAPFVGVLFARHYWVNNNLAVEDFLIAELENLGLRVIPAFSYSVSDPGLGAKGSAQVVQEVFFTPGGNSRIQALVKLQAFFLGKQRGDKSSDVGSAGDGVGLLTKLNVPVFQPVVSSYKSPDEWENDDQGLGADISWSVAMPEFEGVIEPLIIGGAGKFEDSETGVEVEERVPIPERCRRLAQRVKKWVALRQKPVSERKIAFILHNNPCASAEGTVGAAAKLDSLESVARILQTMRMRGYAVDAPKDGKDLINTIMERKAISEFRWTTVNEIVKKGGALSLVPLNQYLKWWKDFPEKVRSRISSAWGEPPGEEVNGVPPAMVYEDKIVVTGVSYGNAVVCVQPKRGCAGPRCDGQVCKILHDPDVPPPHQYLATYRYLEECFGADVIVHVGTHGNVEFLPGKGAGLSEACFPDLCIHEMPHLYIYNSDNPPEGIVAKRRSYATLVDHLQAVMSQAGLYEELEELGRFLSEYEQAKITDKARAHALEHMIIDLIKQTNLDQEINFTKETPFDEVVRKAHEVLSRIRNTQIYDGMHIFGEVPQGERRINFIYFILRFDADEEKSLRKTLCRLMGLELQSLLSDPGEVSSRWQKSHGELLEEIDSFGRFVVAEALRSSGNGSFEKEVRKLLGERLVDEREFNHLAKVQARILDLDKRIEACKEIDFLLNGFDGRYIPAGPSGMIARGRDDILPTGRNFYSLDPRRVPTKAAYRVGEQLAAAVIEKHQLEEGRFPENVAVYWMCADIMWSDGEGMGQIFSLLGVRPVWLSDGRVKGFEIISLEELGRPRIDVTIRVSGITRDNFPECIELLDEAIHAVASLDEPLDMNYVRKHSLEKLGAEDKVKFDEDRWRKATLRIFSSKPGTYRPGVNLAVYASAWKDEKDLSDIFVRWNGYAYGKGIFGQASHDQFESSLKSVDVTFNKVVSDEHDICGCCCYFGTHGGITAAARHISGKHVKAYFGDTREPERVEVRDLADEIRRVVRTKLLNPKWIEGMKRHGYKGAGDISKRVGRVYGWESTTQEVDDWIFDDIARTFVLDEENREFFKENNPWALEEISRRLLEAESRGLWKADPEVLQGLRDAYLEMEGWLEESMGEVEGDFQGGAVDIFSPEDIEKGMELE